VKNPLSTASETLSSILYENSSNSLFLSIKALSLNPLLQANKEGMELVDVSKPFKYKNNYFKTKKRSKIKIKENKFIIKSLFITNKNSLYLICLRNENSFKNDIYFYF